MRSTIFLLLLFGLVEGYKSIATMSGALSYYDYGKCNSEKQESTADIDKLFVAELNKISMFTFPSMDHHTLVHFGSVNGSEPLNIISMAYNSKKQTLLFIGDKIRSRVYQYSILSKNTTYIDFNGFEFEGDCC
ncbi:hypothetical protein M3Y97_00916000 [Aphelenchoides bicaudatus]|nr:hypothetical protein M3Y97_00916000 [Aphelenchoides bicaudatus]